MEKEDQIRDDFSKTHPNANSSTARSLSRTAIREDNGANNAEGSTQENGANGDDDAKSSTREHGANDKEMEEIQRKKITPKKFLKIVVLFAMFVVAWFVIVQYMAADKYEAVVKVVEEGGKIGVNPMTERLDYGDLPKGNASTRFVTIENNGKMGIYVAVVKYGGIAELIKISRNNFVLYSGEKEKLELSLEMPISANKEGYEGKIIIFKLPKVF